LKKIKRETLAEMGERLAAAKREDGGTVDLVSVAAE
jgi:hypothetical protein